MTNTKYLLVEVNKKDDRLNRVILTDKSLEVIRSWKTKLEKVKTEKLIIRKETRLKSLDFLGLPGYISEIIK